MVLNLFSTTPPSSNFPLFQAPPDFKYALKTSVFIGKIHWSNFPCCRAGSLLLGNLSTPPPRLRTTDVDIVHYNCSVAGTELLKNVHTAAAKFILCCIRVTSRKNVLNELYQTLLHNYRQFHILFDFRNTLVGPHPYLSWLARKFFKNISDYFVRLYHNVQLHRYKT